MPQSSPRSLARHARAIARHLSPYWTWMALAALLGLLAAGAGSLDPLFYRYLVDLVVRDAGSAVAPRAALTAAALAVAGLVAVGALQQALGAGLTLAANRVRFDASFALSRRSLAGLLHQPLSAHLAPGEEHGAGALVTCLDRGVAALGQLAGDLLQSLLPNLANLAVVAALLFRLTPRLSWVALAPLPPFLWATLRATQEGVAAEEEVQAGWRRIYRRVHEALAAIKTLKSLTGERAELERYDRSAGAIFHRLWALLRVDAGYGALRGLLATFGRGGVLLYGAALVLGHRMSPGTWIAAVAYAGMLYAPLTGLTGLYTTLSRNLVTAGAALAIPDAETEEPLRAAPAPPAVARGELLFDRVTFRYPGAPAAALRDVSFRAAPGETIALVGPSGGGKTTISDLLLRFYRPERGAIRLDGRDLGDLPPAWLRGQIAAVLQETVLFAGTIAENIAHGRPDAGPERIRAAARAAQADEFIRRLPAGYGTRVGERGARLSGGQRQRLAIARALLRDAPILVLDEASSNLDGESELALNAALARSLAGRTVVLISHRRSSLALADRVLVIADGEIIESGRPADLLATPSACAALFATPEPPPTPRPRREAAFAT